MTPAQAIQHHQEKLNLNLSSLANNSVNPGARSVYYHRDVWMTSRAVLPTTNEAVDSLATTEDTDSPTTIEDTDSPTTIEDVLVTLKEVYKKFGDGESPKALDIWVKRLKSIKSSSQFNSYFSSFGSSVISLGMSAPSDSSSCFGASAFRDGFSAPGRSTRTDHSPSTVADRSLLPEPPTISDGAFTPTPSAVTAPAGEASVPGPAQESKRNLPGVVRLLSVRPRSPPEPQRRCAPKEAMVPHDAGKVD